MHNVGLRMRIHGRKRPELTFHWEQNFLSDPTGSKRQTLTHSIWVSLPSTEQWGGERRMGMERQKIFSIEGVTIINFTPQCQNVFQSG